MGLADENGPLGETIVIKFYGGGPNDGLQVAWPENKLPKRIFMVEVVPELVGLDKQVAGVAQRRRWGYYQTGQIGNIVTPRDNVCMAGWSGWHETWELIDDGF